jgi:predicted amidohydrolase
MMSADTSTNTKIIRVATAQYPLDRYDSMVAYGDKVRRWVTEAAAERAQILVFPEYGAMEYSGAFGNAAANLQSSLALVATATAALQPLFAELAQQFNVTIVAPSGPYSHGDNHYTNACRVYGPSGQSGIQHKLMMTPFEVSWGISAGTQLQIFENADCKFGIAICYDSEFPLLVRALAESGADLILVPSCTEFLSGANRIRTAALARALENGCAVVTSPTVGDALWSPAVDRNTGRAGIYVPAEHGLSDTGIVAEGEINRPMWVYGDIDLGHLARIRTGGEMRNALDWRKQPTIETLGPISVLQLV